LDTTFDRVDNGKIQWIDLDFPEVIEIRRRYISESDRVIFIAKSVFDTSWYDHIKNKDEAMFMFAGVLEYFSDQQIIQLFNDITSYCPGVEIIFDYFSKIGAMIMNKYLLRRTNISCTTRFRWSLEDISDIGKINDHVSVMNNMSLFQEHKKNYPFFKRLFLNRFDRWKISSLAHIKINKEAVSSKSERKDAG